METYKDMFLEAEPNALETLVEEMSHKSTDSYWSRARENEKRSFPVEETVYCFKYQEGSSLPSAGLAILSKGNGNMWYVPNIIPLHYH